MNIDASKLVRQPDEGEPLEMQGAATRVRALI
jgi:hypothetical protein